MGKKQKKEADYQEAAHCSAKVSWTAFAILCVMAFIALVPLLWIFISSFKVEAEVIQAGGFLYLPKTWTLDNFKSLLQQTAPGILLVCKFRYCVGRDNSAGGHNIFHVRIRLCETGF